MPPGPFGGPPGEEGPGENSRLLRRCLLVEGMDVPIKAQGPVSSSIPPDLL